MIHKNISSIKIIKNLRDHISLYIEKYKILVWEIKEDLNIEKEIIFVH